MKAIKLLTLKREFEMFKMKDSDFMKDYTTKLRSFVSQIRLASEQFTDQRVAEKIMVSVLVVSVPRSLKQRFQQLKSLVT